MIKHGKIHKLYGKAKAGAHSHLEPIKDLVTKGVADSKEKITLQPLACDVRGAKKFDGQQCVIARAFTRVYKPQAVAVGRSLAFAVFDGLAIRFRVPAASRKVVDEFDQNGRVRKAPISLFAIHPSWRLQVQQSSRTTTPNRTGEKRKRMKKYGVRAIGGGVAE